MPERGRWTFGDASELKRALVLHPPVDRLKGLLDTAFPIEAAYVAESLQADGLDARMLNAELPEKGERLTATSERGRIDGFDDYTKALRSRDHRVWVQLDHAIREFNPSVVVMWVDTARYGSALATSMIVRGAGKHTKIIWCGPHPTAVPGIVLNPTVDFVIRGEAEKTVLALTRAIRRKEPLEKVKGIAYEKHGEVVNTKPREAARDVDTFMPPGRHLDVSPHGYPGGELAVISSSRGAPVASRYTNDHIAWGRAYRPRTPFSIMSELKQVIAKYRPEKFSFTDPCFTVNSRRTAGLCAALVAENLGIPWSCNSRPDTVDATILEAMSKAGCNFIRFQIGSGSEDMLKRLGVDMTIEQVHQAGEICNSLGIGWAAEFVAGFPSETEADLIATRDLMTELDAAMITLRLLTPEPGTVAFSEARKMGLVPKPVEWAVFSQYNRRLELVKDIPRKRFDELVDEMLEFTRHHNRSLTRRLKKRIASPLRLMKDTLLRFRKR